MKNTNQQWFKDAKYGLFIHWGIFSVLAGEYEGERVNCCVEWTMNCLNIPAEKYRTLAKEFRAEKFSAEDIVRKAKEDWGMKYLVFTTKHHDGFAMWDSKVSDNNVVKATPYGKDILKEFQLACEKYDMKLGLYYSQSQDWDDPDGYMNGHDNSGKNFRKYLDRKCIPQLKELLTGYGKISILWFDTPMHITKEESLELFQLVKDLQPECIVNGRIGNGVGEYLTTGDCSIPKLPIPGDWEVPATLNESWGYNKYDNKWRSSEEILRLLLKIVSRGGNYLLNIGPDVHGQIPEESCKILNEVGRYLKKNGEAVYGTKHMEVYPYDLDWAELTVKEKKLFIHVLKPKAGVGLMNVANKIRRAYIVENGYELECCSKKVGEGDSVVEITLPDEYKQRNWYAICMELEEEWPIFEPIR